MNLSGLKEPFTAKQIHWRVGRMTRAKDKAIPFGYIDARDVMERLDAICGVSGWQAEYPFPGCCRIGILCPINDGKELQWIWKTNGVGVVHYGDNDTPDVREMKSKGNYSDAFKRAAALWGIGQYLYDLPNTTWFPINEYKQFEKETAADISGRYEVWVGAYFKKKKGE